MTTPKTAPMNGRMLPSRRNAGRPDLEVELNVSALLIREMTLTRAPSAPAA